MKNIELGNTKKIFSTLKMIFNQNNLFNPFLFDNSHYNIFVAKMKQIRICALLIALFYFLFFIIKASTCETKDLCFALQRSVRNVMFGFKNTLK